MYRSQIWSQRDQNAIAQSRPAQQQAKPELNQPSKILNHQRVEYFPCFSINTRFGAVALLIFAVILVSGCGVYGRGNGLTTGSSTTGTTAAALSQISCGTQSLTGAQTKACSVYLGANATTSTVVSLKSSNSALQVPASVTVAAGAKTAGFSAKSYTVSNSVSVTITGYGGGATKTDVITVYPAATTTPTLSKISCGTQTLTGPTAKACSVYLSAAATSAVPVTLSTSSSALVVPSALTVAAGAASAGFTATASAVPNSETVTMKATANGVSQTLAMQLNASGTTSSTQHKVQLSWIAPSTSSVAIVGYRVYRATGTSGSYAALNSTVDAQTSYIDSTVQGGTTYEYVVRSVDQAGVESSPSNPTTVNIPAS